MHVQTDILDDLVADNFDPKRRRPSALLHVTPSGRLLAFLPASQLGFLPGQPVSLLTSPLARSLPSC